MGKSRLRAPREPAGEWPLKRWVVGIWKHWTESPHRLPPNLGHISHVGRGSGASAFRIGVCCVGEQVLKWAKLRTPQCTWGDISVWRLAHFGYRFYAISAP
jgi:hypothetical protein